MFFVLKLSKRKHNLKHETLKSRHILKHVYFIPIVRRYHHFPSECTLQKAHPLHPFSFPAFVTRAEFTRAQCFKNSFNY